MRSHTLFTLNIEVKHAESTHQNNMAKAHDEKLSNSTRAKYARQIAKSQRRMIEARMARARFIEAQKITRL